MRKLYTPIFKRFCRQRIPPTRAAMKLTQAKMADILCMDIWSYAGIENGDHSCSGLTLALFLIYCCSNPLNFLTELKEALESTTKAA